MRWVGQSGTDWCSFRAKNLEAKGREGKGLQYDKLYKAWVLS